VVTANRALTFNYADYRAKVPSPLVMRAADEVTLTFHIVTVPAAALN